MIVFYCLPIDGPLRITSKYGLRNTRIKNASYFHHGVDIGRDKSKAKTNLLLVAPGTVIFNGWNKYRGWYIVVRCNEFDILYQHMESQSIHKVGTVLKTRTILGVMVNSSDKSVLVVSIHLHFAVCKDFSKPTEDGRDYEDPLPYLKNIQKEDDMTKEEAKKIVKEKVGWSDKTIEYVADDYRWGDDAIIKLAKALKGE